MVTPKEKHILSQQKPRPKQNAKETECRSTMSSEPARALSMSH